MQMQMGMGMAGAQAGGQPFLAKTQFTNEAEAHKLTDWAPTPLLLGERSLLQEAIRRGLAPVPVASMAWDAASAAAAAAGGGGGGAAGSAEGRAAKKTN